MPRPKATHLRLALATAAILLARPLLPPTAQLNSSHITSPRFASAHTVEIVEDVGATLHIEPNDTPRAGEDTLAWFALTRKGGQTIPLSACDCALTVSSPTAEADLTPSLSAIDAEGYKDIPSAEFTFPAVGQYTLSLTGSPKTPDNFSPFTLAFEVTVAAGQSIPTIPENNSTALLAPKSADEGAIDTTIGTDTDTDNSPQPVAPILLGIGMAIAMGGAIWFLRNKQKP